MAKIVKLNLGGREVEGEAMNFKTIEEGWSRYQLDDGTIVKLKVVTSDIFKIPGTDPMTGLPQLLVRSSNIMSVEPRETYKKGEVQ